MALLKALVLGDAATVLEDAGRALELFEPDAICATNNIGIDWPGRLDYWCTLHPTKCPDWIGIVEALKKRLAAGRNRPQIWGHKPAPGIDRSTEDWRGSTGLLCVKVMRFEEHFDRIVLAGMPMSEAGCHYYTDRVWNTAERYRAGWRKHLSDIAPYVRSMGGWTQEILGAPTPEWINGI